MGEEGGSRDSRARAGVLGGFRVVVGSRIRASPRGSRAGLSRSGLLPQSFIYPSVEFAQLREQTGPAVRSGHRGGNHGLVTRNGTSPIDKRVCTQDKEKQSLS